MMESNIDLFSFNTFGIHATCSEFGRFSSVEELTNLLKEKNEGELLILGGGSNILLTKDFNGTVLKNEIKGIEVNPLNDTQVLVRAGAGEIWHEFVLFCIQNNLAGVENLSLIPGSVGASPMQNIGAYGVEIKDVFHSLEAMHISTGEIHTFSAEECEFGYRESVFKRTLKGQYIILHVTFLLSTNALVNTSYGAIEAELKSMGIEKPGIKEISNAVISIRQSKLPDPKKIGNAGSFFKNPVVSESIASKLLEKHPNAPVYPAESGMKKIAAGWLIEQAGWKGKTFDTFGVHKLQALVLVNYGGSTGEQIFELSKSIIEDVYTKYGIELEREVNIL